MNEIFAGCRGPTLYSQYTICGLRSSFGASYSLLPGMRAVPLFLVSHLYPSLCDGAQALKEMVPALLSKSVLLGTVALLLKLLPFHFQSHGHLLEMNS